MDYLMANGVCFWDNVIVTVLVREKKTRSD